MLINLPEVIGWLGTLSYIIAYLLLSLGKLKSERILYHFLNLLGAIGLIINAFHWEDYPSVVVNFAWLGIASFTMIVIFLKRRNRVDEVI